jgi:hypothetical protein
MESTWSVKEIEAYSSLDCSNNLDYSRELCQELAEEIGLSLGGFEYDFIGDYTTKGCYSYSSGEYA